jgi:hypothetical protein
MAQAQRRFSMACDEKRASLLLIPILCLALGLRLAPLGQNRFLEDEALYATWGLQIATGADPMLDWEPVDKPPLFPYTLALSFLLVPTGAPVVSVAGYELAARLPSLLASVVSVALVYALSRALYRQTAAAGAALLAALLLALSPFDLLFASTAFTDPLMTALTLASLWAAARARPGAAGLLAGLAFAAKQQGLLFLPLVAAILTSALSASSHRAAGSLQLSSAGKGAGSDAPAQAKRPQQLLLHLGRQPWVRFALAWALVVAGVVAWDQARIQRPGFFEQSVISYGGLKVVPWTLLGERSREWLRLLGSFWVSPALNLLLIAAGALWLAASRVVDRIPRPVRMDGILLAFVAGYLVLHGLISVQVWDRYLLSLVPLLALVAGRAIALVGLALPTPTSRTVYAVAATLAVILLVVSPVSRAVRSDLPLGGDHGAYDGIDEMAAYLRAHAPQDSVLYHFWLGYHYRFYLYGAPLRLHWYPDLADLTHDAYVYRREPRFIAFPSWRDSAPVVAALTQAGFALTPVLETHRRDGSISFRLYRLEGPLEGRHSAPAAQQGFAHPHHGCCKVGIHLRWARGGSRAVSDCHPPQKARDLTIPRELGKLTVCRQETMQQPCHPPSERRVPVYG